MNCNVAQITSEKKRVNLIECFEIPVIQAVYRLMTSTNP